MRKNMKNGTVEAKLAWVIADIKSRYLAKADNRKPIFYRSWVLPIPITDISRSVDMSVNRYAMPDLHPLAYLSESDWADHDKSWHVIKCYCVKATTGGLWCSSPPILQTFCHWSNSITNQWRSMGVVFVMELLHWQKVCKIGGDEHHRPPVVALTQ